MQVAGTIHVVPLRRKLRLNTARQRCAALLLLAALAPAIPSTTEAHTTPIVQAAPAQERQQERKSAAARRSARHSQRVIEGEERAERTREAFENYKDHTNLLLTLISILLGLVGLLFPIVTYFTSLLPGNRMIDEAKRTLAGLDEKFAELSAKHQARLIDEAIAQLGEEAESTRQSAAMYLSLNARYQFSETQILAICRAIDNAGMVIRSQLLDVISRHSSPHVTELLVRELDGKQVATVLAPALRHCAVTNSSRLRKRIKEWLVFSQENQQQLGFALGCAAAASPTELKEFINDEVLLKQFGMRDKGFALAVLRATASIDHAAWLDESYLGQELGGEKWCFFGPANNRLEISGARDAHHVELYKNGVHTATYMKGSKEFERAAAAHAQPDMQPQTSA